MEQSDNLVSKIAEMLGIEVGEIFNLADLKNDQLHVCQGEPTKYRLSNERVCEYYIPAGNRWSACGALYEILTGKQKIVKPLRLYHPFDPEFLDVYYSVEWGNDQSPYIGLHTWLNESGDYMRRRCRNCFRTQEQAEIIKRVIYEQLVCKDEKK